MKTNRTGKNGFTLVELMISIALASILAYVLFTIMRVSNEQTQSSDVKMVLQDSAREGLYKMTQEIRLSAPDQLTIGSGGETVQFKIPNPSSPVGSDYKIDWTNAYTVTYALGGLNNRQIIRTNTTTGETQVVANDVTSVIFSGDTSPARVVTITMSLQRDLTNNRQMTATPLQLIGKAELKNP